MFGLPVNCIQLAVPGVEIALAVVGGCAGLADVVDDYRTLALSAPKFEVCTVTSCVHVGVDGGYRPAIAAWIDDVRAIEQKTGSAAIRDSVRGQAVADRAALGAHIEKIRSAIAEPRRGCGHARKDLEQFGEVSASQRKLFNVLCR